MRLLFLLTPFGLINKEKLYKISLYNREYFDIFLYLIDTFIKIYIYIELFVTKLFEKDRCKTNYINNNNNNLILKLQLIKTSN